MEINNEFIQPEIKKTNPFRVSYVKNLDELKEKLIGDTEEVESNQYLLLENNENITSFSFGANPCVSGILQTNNGDIYMFHDYAESLTTIEQENIIKNIKRGVIGSGSNESSKAFMSKLLNHKNIKIIPSPGENYDFNIVFVKSKNSFNVLPGLYFSFEPIEE